MPPSHAMQLLVIVARLDRLARSTRDRLEPAEQITAAGASLKSSGEPWANATTPAGKIVLTVFAVIAEFELALLRDRTGAGRVAAKKRGVKFGRKPKLSPEQVVLALLMVDEGQPVQQVADAFGVHATTIYRCLPAAQAVA